MADVLFIVNPASGAGRAAREWSAIEGWLPSTGIPYEAALTTRPLEATQMAERAVRQSRPVIVAVGGDGTLNEVVNGFFHNGAPIPTTSRLAMLPLGTGGDFRRTLKIPLDPKAAVQILRTGIPRRLDAGCVTYKANDGSTAVRHFINIADAGLGGDVVHRVNNGGKRLGSATFTLASLMSLLAWKNKPMNVVVDGVAHDLKAQQVVIANCQYFGGGMRMAPTASPTDGVFDVILVGNAGKLETHGRAQPEGPIHVRQAHIGDFAAGGPDRPRRRGSGIPAGAVRDSAGGDRVHHAPIKPHELGG